MNFAWARLALLAGMIGVAGSTAMMTGPTAAATAAQDDHRPAGIAWHDGDVDSAFARARRESRPVFLYWGAVWCPPCNQLKATLFKRTDFQERSRLFVPVYIDGDAPGAQQLGTRFKVRGYPTTIVLRPDGTEITRLPGEVDPQRYLDVLGAALAATHPVPELRDAALSGARPLSVDEWRLLAYYSWETDEQQVAAKGETAALVARLAAACPARYAADRNRLVLKALALRAEAAPAAHSQGGPQPASGARQVPPPGLGREDAQALVTLHRVLADPAQARANFDVLVYSADKSVALLGAGNTARRDELARAWDAALVRLAGDDKLSDADRLAAVDARLGLARRDAVPLPADLVAAARAAAVRADRAAKTAVERQSVISGAADLLASAGLFDESDRMLQAELARSHSPYYFMLGLAANARKRGDKAAALDWYGQAHAAARGPATRLQWGASHVRALIELAPDDAAAIERTVSAVLAEIEPVPASFEGRNQAALQRMGARLNAWGVAHADAWDRLGAQWRALCDRLPASAPQRRQCLRPLTDA